MQGHGYVTILEFVQETSDEKAEAIITQYLHRKSDAKLYDGLLRPCTNSKAKWYFLAWLLRDTAAQRLQPLLKDMPGSNSVEKKSYLLNDSTEKTADYADYTDFHSTKICENSCNSWLFSVNSLNEIRKFVEPLFPDPANWEWAAVSEIMLTRPEGSRRALKGTLFEELVRRNLRQIIEEFGVGLRFDHAGRFCKSPLDGLQKGVFQMSWKCRNTRRLCHSERSEESFDYAGERFLTAFGMTGRRRFVLPQLIMKHTLSQSVLRVWVKRRLSPGIQFASNGKQGRGTD